MNRRSVLRAFLAAPVAARLAPFVRPAPLDIDMDLILLSSGYGYLATALRRRLITLPGRFLPEPFYCSPDEYAFLTDGRAPGPRSEPEQFYDGDFFLNREGGNGS